VAKNPSIGKNEEWTADGIHYRELIRQEYENMVFAAGVIEGDPVKDVPDHYTVWYDPTRNMFITGTSPLKSGCMMLMSVGGAKKLFCESVVYD
jgi:hypothetical protein